MISDGAAFVWFYAKAGSYWGLERLAVQKVTPKTLTVQGRWRSRVLRDDPRVHEELSEAQAYVAEKCAAKIKWHEDSIEKLKAHAAEIAALESA